MPTLAPTVHERLLLLRLDRVHRGDEPERDGRDIAPRQDGASYEGVIEGVNLWGALSPPHVTVGGEAVEGLAFARDDRSLRGVLRRRPDGAGAVVDYGFARAQLHG